MYSIRLLLQKTIVVITVLEELWQCSSSSSDINKLNTINSGAGYILYMYNGGGGGGSSSSSSSSSSRSYRLKQRFVGEGEL